jgi:hypothetical protein
MLPKGLMHMASRKPNAASRKMRDYRARLRASGLRPVQIWVPDTRTENFAAEARRQSLLVSRRASEAEAVDFIEAAANTASTP